MADRWYVATIIMQCKVATDEQGPWTLDESICVLLAPSNEVEYDKAVYLGKSAEHSYLNAYGDEVRWTFAGLNNLEELVSNSIADGTEIRSRLFKSDNPAASVRNKEELLVSWVERNRHRVAEDILRDTVTGC